MLNLEGVGHPIMKIKGGKNNNKIVYVNPNFNDNTHKDTKKIKNAFHKIELGDGEEFVPVPNNKINRNVNYIAGQSGSGKTYYTKLVVKELLKQKPDIPVYLFSPFDEDESLDEINPQRVEIGMDLVTDPIDPKELKNSCVIFDDIDSIKLKTKKETREVKEAIHMLLHQCLEIGRHYNIDVIQTNHLLCNGNETKRILNESHHITFFPHSCGRMSAKRLCEEYGGIDMDTLKKIKKMKTRWTTIHKNFPIMVSTQKCIFNPNMDEED